MLPETDGRAEVLVLRAVRGGPRGADPGQHSTPDQPRQPERRRARPAPTQRAARQPRPPGGRVALGCGAAAPVV